MFLDGDDYLDTQYLLNALFYLNFLDCEFIGAWCQTFTETNSERNFGEVWKVLKAPTWENLITSNAFPVSSLIRRSAFDSIEGWRDFDSQGVRQDEAVDLWRRLVLKGFMGFNLQQPMIFLRRHASNLSSRPSEVKLFQNNKMRETWNDLVRIEGKKHLKHTNRDYFYNPESLKQLTDVSENSQIVLFLLPDRTLFGAGKVITWTYSQLAFDNNVIILNCDINGLGGTVIEPINAIKPNKILELGAILDARDWDIVITDIIALYKVTEVFTFGHPFINNLVLKCTGVFPYTKFTAWMFNTMSANAVWLAKNPNTYSRVLVESEVSNSYLKSSGWDQQRVVKINHSAHRVGVDFSKVQVLNPEKGVLRVLWFGRMASEKQPWLFLDVAQRMQNHTTVEFIMCGSGPLRNEIESESHHHKNLSIQPSKISALEAMSDVDVYVSTSSSTEGRPLAILEALEMGLQVFTPNSGSVAEFITDGYRGITIYEDRESLCKLIQDYSQKFHEADKNAVSTFNRRISEQRVTYLF